MPGWEFSARERSSLRFELKAVVAKRLAVVAVIGVTLIWSLKAT